MRHIFHGSKYPSLQALLCVGHEKMPIMHGLHLGLMRWLNITAVGLTYTNNSSLLISQVAEPECKR